MPDPSLQTGTFSPEPESGLPAEQAYLFRHAVVRDAAYELQLPADRARLHALALNLIEQILEGRAPRPRLFVGGVEPLERHASDSYAEELAHHARAGGDQDAHEHYLLRAALIAEELGQSESAIRLWKRLADLVDGELHFEARRRVAIAQIMCGLFQEARSTMEAAVGTLDRHADTRLRGVLTENLATACYLCSDPAKAENLLNRAIEDARSCGNLKGEATALGNLALLYSSTQRGKQALDANREALDICRRTGDSRGITSCLTNLAGLYLRERKYLQAEEALKSALQPVGSEGERLRNRMLIIEMLAIAAWGKGSADDAIGKHEQALRLANQLGDRHHEALITANLGLAYASRGDLERAEHYYRKAAHTQLEAGNREAWAFATANLGVVLRRSGRASEAVDCLRAGYSHLQTSRNLLRNAMVACDLAEALALAGEPESRPVWAAALEQLEGIDMTLATERREKMRQFCAQAGIRALDEPEPA